MNKENQYVPGMLGCSDGGCIFEYKRPGTMVTNGGCQCQKELMRTEAGMNAYRTIMWMRSNWPSMPFAGAQEDNSGHTWMPLEQFHNFHEVKYAAYEDGPVPVIPKRTMLHKVSMIKEVREKTGAGLKESKEAVDFVIDDCHTFDQVIMRAVDYYFSKGYCRMGDNCVCGGDTPRVRKGCFEWKPSV